MNFNEYEPKSTEETALECDLPTEESATDEAEFPEDESTPKASRKIFGMTLNVGKAFGTLKRFVREKSRPLAIGLSVAVIGLAVLFNWLLFSDDATLDNTDAGGTIPNGSLSSTDSNGEGILGESVYVDADDSGDTEEDSYFAMSQLSRQRARDESLEVLRLVIEDEDALAEVKDKAYADANRMAAEIASEANIETLIMAKGFEECVAVVSNQNANIIVKSDGLLINEIAQIKEIVYEEAGIIPQNIKIIEKN